MFDQTGCKSTLAPDRIGVCLCQRCRSQNGWCKFVCHGAIFRRHFEVHIAIPFSPIFGLEELLGVHIDRTALCAQMLMDLDGLHLSVGGEEVLKLWIPVLTQGVAHIGCNAMEESFPDGPLFSVLLLFLFHAFPCLSGCGVIDSWIVWSGLHFLDPHQTHYVFVFILLGWGTGPVIGDVFQFGSQIGGLFLEGSIIVSWGVAMEFCEGYCSYNVLGLCLNGLGSWRHFWFVFYSPEFSIDYRAPMQDIRVVLFENLLRFS